jgi:ABC-type branched-subunit amino acid transport system permease subunit
MKKNWVAKILTMVLLAALFFVGFGYVVMRLWNWLTPALFGWHTIGFWQAIGILVLSKLLFGGFHGRHGRHWRHRINERWGRMTPEEREKFRQSMRSRCGSVESAEPAQPAAAPKG